MRLPSPSKSKSELSGQSGHALPDCYQRFVPIADLSNRSNYRQLFESILLDCTTGKSARA
jgi:hypothetical protein